MVYYLKIFINRDNYNANKNWVKNFIFFSDVKYKWIDTIFSIFSYKKKKMFLRSIIEKSYVLWKKWIRKFSFLSIKWETSFKCVLLFTVIKHVIQVSVVYSWHCMRLLRVIQKKIIDYENMWWIFHCFLSK